MSPGDIETFLTWACREIDDYSKNWLPNGVGRAVAAAIKSELRRRAATAVITPERNIKP